MINRNSSYVNRCICLILGVALKISRILKLIKCLWHNDYLSLITKFIVNMKFLVEAHRLYLQHQNQTITLKQITNIKTLPNTCNTNVKILKFIEKPFARMTFLKQTQNIMGFRWKPV